MIAYLLSGNVKEYQLHLMKRISKEFGLDNPSDRIAPHLTLKSPFEAEDISKLEIILEDFCNENSKQDILMKGTGNFDNRVFYLNAELSDGAKKLFLDFLKGISKLEYVPLNNYDQRTDNFHSTIVYPKPNTNITKLRSFLAALNPMFKTKIDNIYILKKIRGIWRVHKRFELK